MTGSPGGATPKPARFIFLDPRAHQFWGDWERAADDTVALLQAEAGRDPYDKDLTDLVGELSTRSDDFRARWARHDVRRHHIGAKPFHHPVVGDLHLTYESLDLSADNLTLVAYGTEPGSDSEDQLRLLASWATTHVQSARHPVRGPDRSSASGELRRTRCRESVTGSVPGATAADGRVGEEGRSSWSSRRSTANCPAPGRRSCSGPPRPPTSPTPGWTEHRGWFRSGSSGPAATS